ncbi:nucleotide exchange factor GrpE [Flavihumibacter rivuli]|uniref:nucleotide exchange factor GrpE n=1 Tax=Flavihumibacter rivuli TaxID=2838156 RepID=UPI001BDEF4CB|nr:nucleotide exchange factor GrpE [Flavihumibacter rivuli]ULQ58275.1 nucleotide exchange factor GrpE [Flavihumibacter rivuli]
MEEKDVNATAGGQETMDNQAAGFDINADSDVPGTSHLNEPVKEAGAIEKLELELADMKDKYLRQAAEFDNFRKRTAKERLELIQTAGREVITNLLEVLDDSERAQKQIDNSQDLQALKDGVNLVFSKFRNILQSKGLKAMESIGTDFDPDKHEAITEIPAPSENLKGKVLDEVEKGYYLNDKIIRFAKVVVGK